jgi:hypothetical protein
MLEPGALTHYLRRLNREDRFRGRPFAQLRLGAKTDAGANGPAQGQQAFTEFTLRASNPTEVGR